MCIQVFSKDGCTTKGGGGGGGGGEVTLLRNGITDWSGKQILESPLPHLKKNLFPQGVDMATCRLP